MKLFKKSCAALLVTVTLVLAWGALTATAATQKVNPQLADRMKMFDQERLIKVGERVYVAFGYEYSNYTFIEGDDGIIVVDTGWFPGQAKRGIADFREQVSDKPIVAILYTHLHTDHFGGAGAIMKGEDGNIPVYGPEGWERIVNEGFSNLRPTIIRRANMQMGILLPEGEEGTVGNGINRSPRADGIPELAFPPTIEVGDEMEVVIAGVRIQMMYTDGDVPENLFIWLPDDKVLFTGDTPMHGTFPAIETVRFEADRNPRALYAVMDKVLELEPEYLINGHGRVMMGAEDVRDVAIANRDVTQFMVDQLDRLFVKGLSPDQIVDTLELPPALAKHPDLQPYYHRVEWMIRQMYVKRAGFIGESMDYVSLTNNQEARRLVPLLGGPAKVRQQARAALDADDARWASRLATYALEVDPKDAEARKIRQDAFLRVARTTVSANERNYMLSIIEEENGAFDWQKISAQGEYEVIKGQELDMVLGLMRSRFRAEAADNEALIARVTVSGQPRYYQVRNNILIISEEAPGKVDASLVMERDTLDRIAANLTTWSAALESGKIQVDGDAATASKLSVLIE